jgi:hypothetical protein
VIGLMSYETSQFKFPQLKGMEFFTTLEQNAYGVLYGSIPEKFPDYLQTVQPMIDSFQIISKVG